ncbi:MAG TPA: sulfatase-like hydrolase/transferase [Polyangiaceae bacterium]|nr:sulfatase-like hydrolase/transferase [Polyangiaceae bacterium]
MRDRRLETALVDAAAVVAAWGALLLAENVALWFLWREQFSGGWELSLSRHTVVPMALAGLAPLSFVAVALWSAAKRAAQGARRAVWVLALAGAVAGGAFAVGVSGGRHFASWPIRLGLVAGLSGLGGLAAGHLVPRVTALARRPVLLAALGVVMTVGTWLADGYVLPRLYAGFHAAMFAGSLAGASLIGIAFRAPSAPTWPARVFATVVASVVALCAAWTPHAAHMLDRAANLRIALVEHAPLLGRTVAAAARVHHVTPDDSYPSATAGATAPGEVARSLDWSGRDLVLLTVDALRADHVSAYGYARQTTPNVDALAHEGTLFERAYCPTPHTSYSITSMLTGKYLRPLLELGLGEDSETWPQSLRRYGWRTAAFYPPAVFFIDESRFTRFEGEHLGFEYAKVEFGDPELREKQVSEYLEGAARDAPIFLWVHFFEPHEPYVTHPDHVFRGGPPDVDAYDSEVATADDGIGRIAGLVRARRPGAVVIVTADHGEEFGEHGGRYHGTTVYEEQVRVPIVVSGPGVRRGQRVATVVQTIDLLPTALSALGIPRPPRLRGRDLGPLLAGDATLAADAGLAFAETDDYAMLAAGDDRLVCQRRAAACAVYRPKDDPGEHRDVSGDQVARFDALRAMMRAVERDHGRYEASGGPGWPEAIRRGLQGEGDVALDAATLLDDADVVIRRKAAEVCFRLHVPATVPASKRALDRDEDQDVRRWSALALARTGEPVAPLVDALLKDPGRDWRRRSALALAERGEGRACDEVASWWEDVLPAHGSVFAGRHVPGSAGEEPDREPLRVALDLVEARELVAATGRARCRSAVPALVRALDDVRIRAGVADALGEIGDDRARAPLLALLVAEPYATARPREARALLALGMHTWSAAGAPAPAVEATLASPARASALKLLVLLSDASASLEARVAGAPLAATVVGTEVRVIDLAAPASRGLELDLRASTGGIIALWLVPADRLD